MSGAGINRINYVKLQQCLKIVSKGRLAGVLEVGNENVRMTNDPFLLMMLGKKVEREENLAEKKFK